MIWELLVLAFLVLLNGFFAMAELAIVSARRVRLQEMAKAGKRGAASALRLLDDLDVGACGGRRPRPAVDEEREHERARDHQCAGTHDQRDHPHDGAA